MRLATLLGITLLLAGCALEKPADKPATNQPAVASRSCSFCPEKSPKGCTLCVVSNPLLTVTKDGNASAPLRLCNRGSQDTTLDLDLSDFYAKDDSGNPYPLSVSRRLSAAAQDHAAIVSGRSPLAANACIDVSIDLTGHWQAGVSSAELTNGTERLVEMKAVRYQVPFNIKVDGPTPELVDVAFTLGRNGKLRLRNDDDIAYSFRWHLELGEHVDGGTSRIPAHGSISLPVTQLSDGFSFFESGFLRSAAGSGTLTLVFEPDPSFQVLPVPQKRYPVTARVSYFSDGWQRSVNYAAILFVLIVGIVVSLLVNYVLPTQKKRVDIKQKLAELEGHLAGVGDVIDSRILNFLRLEKKRMREQLRELLPILPQSAMELSKLETRIDWLVHQVDLTSRVGELLQVVETTDGTLAVTESDRIRALCRDVLEIVRKSSASAEDIATATKHIESAERIAELADEDPSQEALDDLKSKAAAALKSIPTAPLPADSGWQSCESILKTLQHDLQQADIPDRTSYVRKARAVCQAELIVRFATIVEASSSSEMRKRRLQRAPDLLGALMEGADESTERARDIVDQIEQNVTVDDLLTEMEKDHSMRVEIDPPTPLAFQLITYRVRFRRPGLDAATAQEEIACTWYVNGEKIGERLTFAERGGHGAEAGHTRGWLIGHYLVNETFKWQRLPGRAWRWLRAALSATEAQGKSFTVEARFPTVPGAKIPPATVVLERTKDYIESRSILAAASLMITVLIVAIGLIAGAQEKLQTLDWLSGTVAVLILGFGADTLKTLISKT